MEEINYKKAIKTTLGRKYKIVVLERHNRIIFNYDWNEIKKRIIRIIKDNYDFFNIFWKLKILKRQIWEY